MTPGKTVTKPRSATDRTKRKGPGERTTGPAASGSGRSVSPARAAAVRSARVERKTRETDIALTLDLDGEGRSKIRTGIGFLDHMLTSLATHARFDLDVRCRGDLHVDAHHSVEDVGIAFGQALRARFEHAAHNLARPRLG